MDSETIKNLRKALGLTQEEFAHKLGVTLCTVNRWENNRSFPSPLARQQIEKLVERLNKPQKVSKPNR